MSRTVTPDLVISSPAKMNIGIASRAKLSTPAVSSCTNSTGLIGRSPNCVATI